MTNVCEIDKCVGCGACLETCSKDAITIVDNNLSLNAEINTDICINCGACSRVCQNNRELELLQPLNWAQGWAEDEVRKKSSSGGIAAAIMKNFIEGGGIVYSCCFENGNFCFRKVESTDDVQNFVGSKYVKSTPFGIYKAIKTLLSNSEKVLFIGLPCQVAAVKLYVGKLGENLFTIDLICHGSPSQNLFKQYLSEEKIDIQSVNGFSFRTKTGFDIKTEEKTVTSCKYYDWWTEPFLQSLIYTENCYHCRYAQTKRASDLTIGDSWGTSLNAEERKKGVSLMLVMTDKGEQLLNSANIQLHEVDVEKAIKANTQLSSPENKPVERSTFENNIHKGYKKAIYKSNRYLIMKKAFFASTFGKAYIKIRTCCGNGGGNTAPSIIYKLKFF